ncbi:xanthine phosphoribosyltransferase / XPRT [Leishmania donovani]|uniref:Xanthine phosphoribosyltransferase n=3 Tax=Leishmania donovani species complex TaxID=38574 RepID=E9AGU7_LEIIN|nr:xanthine phosphoribosyltransferase [Leishmania infantum JPCM5]AAD50967.1 xanthine phosphoribosyltransferase XPRT [Leishmania donovani]CAC9485907.1 xanthine_phosphoribosyltransferase [Leishmania infantum]AYU78560.1 xanthine phosphoribosyltransferase [Leishmania donovani]CAJ1988569.1 xanthine phosphoribosyltransferase / XPRT [Leishmania donovani]CBZ08611.1 xanthine phosphoribosyltransferase [Leishmania infantum JPCM5]|eukprot:XP_003392448.1 xanthine phosphoribosyltransferase [Leishmania infantum JPCM5]
MLPTHSCKGFVDAQGRVFVDGREYPMASGIVATEDVIQTNIKAMAHTIAKDYKSLSHRDARLSPSTAETAEAAEAAEAPISYDNPLIIISVLKGSYIFTSDFIRYLGDCGLPHVVDFVRLASYNSGTKSTGQISMLAGLRFENLRGKHVLIVEDVCDSGRTLRFLRDYIMEKFQPKSIKTLVMVNKEQAARKVDFDPEYFCLAGPNKYIVGYGFEVNDRYRDLRHILILRDGEATRYPAKL